MTYRFLLAALFTAFLLPALASEPVVPLVVNGDFETGDYSSWSWAPASDVTEWDQPLSS